MMDHNLTFFKESLTRLRNGLHKLTEANDLIGVMKEELVALGPQIEMKEKVKKIQILKKKTKSIFDNKGNHRINGKTS